MAEYFRKRSDKYVRASCEPISGMVRPVAGKDPWVVDIGRRIRAAMVDSEIPNAAALATLLNMEDSKSRVRNWVNGTQRPMVNEGIRLKKLFGVTLDWLYEGDTSGLPGPKLIRLMGAMQGLPIPFP